MEDGCTGLKSSGQEVMGLGRMSCFPPRAAVSVSPLEGAADPVSAESSRMAPRAVVAEAVSEGGSRSVPRAAEAGSRGEMDAEVLAAPDARQEAH